jgi:hypothetical protein
MLPDLLKKNGLPQRESPPECGISTFIMWGGGKTVNPVLQSFHFSHFGVLSWAFGVLRSKKPGTAFTLAVTSHCVVATIEPDTDPAPKTPNCGRRLAVTLVQTSRLRTLMLIRVLPKKPFPFV